MSIWQCWVKVYPIEDLGNLSTDICLLTRSIKKQSIKDLLPCRVHVNVNYNYVWWSCPSIWREMGQAIREEEEMGGGGENQKRLAKYCDNFCLLCSFSSFFLSCFFQRFCLVLLFNILFKKTKKKKNRIVLKCYSRNTAIITVAVSSKMFPLSRLVIKKTLKG